MLSIYVLCILSCLLSTSNGYRGRARYRERKCEKTTIPLCKDVGYNLTYMPNQFGHKTQFDAGLIIHQFWPLVLINCSPRLKHFVCSLYAPMCDPIYHKEIVPCRSFCEEVRDSCVPVMKENSFQWPEHLKCTQFPTRKENGICMKPEKSVNKTGASRNPKPIQNTQKPKNRNNRPATRTFPVVSHRKPHVVIDKWRGGCGCLCQAPFVYRNKSTAGDEIPPCALPCKKYFFNEHQESFISFWLGLWSILAFSATLITIMTFLIDRSRFTYTERPIILISLCYMFVSFGYILRLIYGHEAIACNSQTNILRYSATGPARCTAVFILSYFFTNVAWIWWVVLSMNWFLSIGLKWTSDAISCYSQYFHFIAWLIPTVQTMAILAKAAIDGDPVSGICSVGNHDNNTLTIFVIAPLLIYSMLALSFFVAGLIAVFQGERVLQDKEHIISIKQSRYVSKIGVFTFLIFIPSLVLIGCYFYEHNNRELWEKSTNCPCIKDKRKPAFYMYLLKYMMSLIIGLLTGFWVLNVRTLEAWKRVFGNLCSKENKSNLIEHRYQDPVAV